MRTTVKEECELEKLIHIDGLLQECGYFKKSESNGGYGCKHKDNDEESLENSWMLQHSV